MKEVLLKLRIIMQDRDDTEPLSKVEAGSAVAAAISHVLSVLQEEDGLDPLDQGIHLDVKGMDVLHVCDLDQFVHDDDPKCSHPNAFQDGESGQQICPDCGEP